MEISVAIGAGILGKIFEYTVAPVGRQMGYLFCYTSNVEMLRSQARDLKHKNEDMQHRVDEARRNSEEIETGVLDWMSGADRMLEEAETFLKDEGHAKARFSCGSSPSLVSRHQLSRKAKKITALVVTANEGAEKFSTISYRPRIESAIGLFKGYQAFETRKKALKGVMEAVRNPNVRMVSIYGMGGIGKTMLAKEVMRQAKEEMLFSEIIMTSVSKTPNTKEIQQEIADNLDLKFDKLKSTTRRADLLRNRLKQEKKFLLVLDDIWNKLELLEIGIHFEDDQRGCKILLTSRSRDVVCKDMDVEKSFSLDPLSSDEAKDLFRKVVGNVMERPNFRDLAHQLVEECAGLPIAIVTVASALKNKTEPIWKDALLQLRNSNPVNIEGMPTKVYSSIRWSYDALESEEAKSLLLLCSLHGEDENIRIEDLMKYSAGWGLFEDVVTLEETRNRVNSLVDTLKSRCLLLDSDVHEAVKMHDIIRDISIWIAANERSTYSLSDVSKLEQLLNKQRLKDAKVISILDTDFGELPEKFESPHIELLIMRFRARYSSTRTIPEHFFEETKELKVLVLNEIPGIISPLSSFHLPHNLRSLCLPYSKLEDVGLIGDLKNLKILDLSSTDICQLPKKIGQLNRLQLLDLRGCQSLKVIEPNVLSSLVRLEELYMAETFNEWEVEGVNNKRRNASLIELKNLQQLTTLYLCVQDIKMFPTESLFGDKLQRYQIHIGENGYYEDSRTSLFLSGCERSQLIGFQALMRRSERISLIGLSKGKNNVVYDLDKDGFPQLNRLELSDCDEVQYVVDALEQKSTVHTCSPAFQSLEELQLRRLENLEMICHGKLIANSFSQLREVDVSSCGRLKNLFPLSIARRLHEIEVSGCETMEEIVVHDEREDEVVFDELRYLRLRSLPKFVQFMCWSQLGVTADSSSAESSSYALFGEKVALPTLELLSLSEINVKKLWADQLPSTSNHMQNLSHLSLVKLRMVDIRECRSLEVIFLVTKKQGGEEDGTSLSEKLLLPQLRSLRLTNLPNLKTLCGMIHKENAQLGEQQPLFNAMVALSKLESLSLSEINVKKLWTDQLPSTSNHMQNLSELTVEKCNELEYISSIDVAKSLVKLQQVMILKCKSLEVIFLVTKKQGGEEDGTSLSEKLLLPQLRSLELSDLPNLKTLCGTVGQENVQLGEQQPLFNGMIGFSGLDQLELNELNIESLWPDFDHKPLATTSYMENLTSLEVENCNKLKYLFTFAMAERLIKLESLEVRDCSEMEKVVAVKEEYPPTSEQILFPKLESISLSNLGGLKSFCGGAYHCIQIPTLSKLQIENCLKLKTFVDKQGENELDATKPFFHENIDFSELDRLELNGLNIVSLWPDFDHKPLTTTSYMENLTSLRVRKCNKLKYLLSFTVAERLVKLRSLLVSDCSEMEDVVVVTKKLASEEYPPTSEQILFPKLECIVLSNLGGLKSFCGGADHRIQIPTLSKLQIEYCLKLKTFVVKQGENKLDATKPFFNVAFPNLKSVQTDWKEGINAIFGRSQSPVIVPSRSLKELRLKCTTQDEPISLSIFDILRRHQNLERLNVSGCFVNIGTCQRDEHHEGILPHIQSSRLMSFNNLTQLEVSECHELTYLLDSSAARSLAQLRVMIIRSCREMKDIIRDCKEGDETTEDDAFDFQRLEILVLRDLPTLKSFYSGNNAMMFPRLQKLFVSQCPEIKSFSCGIVTTLVLRTVITEIKHEWMWNYTDRLEDSTITKRECWNGDVDTTIRKLWEESSNSSFQQSFAVTDVEDCFGEGTSIEGAGM